MMTTSYRVELDIYSGPLDLLLYLVRRNEVDIVDLPIAPIAAEFESYLDVLESIDLDLGGDFVVMLSTLAEVKSRMVLPRAEEEAEPELEADARGDLIQQLLEYKKFKDAARVLEERAAQWQERYPRLTDDRPRRDRDASRDRIKEVELWDLVSALGRVLRKQQILEETNIRYDQTPIAVYMQQIGEQIHSLGRVAFTSLFELETLRSKIIGMFLAVLELLRHRRFRAEQTQDYGEIWLLPPLEDGSDDDPQNDPVAEEVAEGGQAEEPPSESDSDDEDA